MTITGASAINGMNADYTVSTPDVLTLNFTGVGGNRATDTMGAAIAQSGANLTISGNGTLRVTGSSADVLGIANTPGRVVNISLGSGGLIDVQGGAFVNGGWGGGVWTNNLADMNIASGAIFDVWDGGNTIRVDALTGAGSVQNGSNGGGARSFVVGADNGSGTFSGVIGGGTGRAGDNIISLTKEGAGTQVLTGANTYSGLTTISGGTLQIGDGGTSGSLGTGAVTTNAMLVLNRSNALSVTNSISGTGSLTQLGTGIATLSAANTYSGGTTINAGRVELTNSSGVGTGGVSIAAGGVLWLNSNTMTVANNITLNGTTSGGALVSGDRPANNVNTLSGTITLAATSNIASWWNDKTLALTGKITGAGGLSLDRATSIGEGDPVGGRFLISGTANDYAGNTTVNGRAAGDVGSAPAQAMLVLGANNALPATTSLTLNTANVYLSGFSQTVAGLGSSGASSVVNGSATPATLTVNNATAGTFGGTLGGAGANENNFSLTKSGSGTLTLSAANTYTGATSVNAGTLAVNGSLGNTAVSVASTATLGGSGVIGGPTSILAGGILAPGNSPGTLTFDSSLTLDNTSILNFEINPINTTVGGGINDLIVANNGLTLDGILNISGTGDFLAATQGSTWRLFNYTGSFLNNSLTLGSTPTLAAGLSFNLDTSATGEVNLIIVPEPGTLALAAGGIAIAAAAYRRRRSNAGSPIAQAMGATPDVTQPYRLRGYASWAPAAAVPLTRLRLRSHQTFGPACAICHLIDRARAAASDGVAAVRASNNNDVSFVVLRVWDGLVHSIPVVPRGNFTRCR